MFDFSDLQGADSSKVNLSKPKYSFLDMIGEQVNAEKARGVKKLIYLALSALATGYIGSRLVDKWRAESINEAIKATKTFADEKDNDKEKDKIKLVKTSGLRDVLKNVVDTADSAVSAASKKIVETVMPYSDPLARNLKGDPNILGFLSGNTQTRHQFMPWFFPGATLITLLGYYLMKRGRKTSKDLEKIDENYKNLLEKYEKKYKKLLSNDESVDEKEFDKTSSYDIALKEKIFDGIVKRAFGLLTSDDTHPITLQEWLHGGNLKGGITGLLGAIQLPLAIAAGYLIYKAVSDKHNIAKSIKKDEEAKKVVSLLTEGPAYTPVQVVDESNRKHKAVRRADKRQKAQELVDHLLSEPNQVQI